MYVDWEGPEGKKGDSAGDILVMFFLWCGGVEMTVILSLSLSLSLSPFRIFCLCIGIFPFFHIAIDQASHTHNCIMDGWVWEVREKADIGCVLCCYCGVAWLFVVV